MLQKNCQQCNKIIIRPNRHMSNLTWTNKKYCSVKCYLLYKKSHRINQYCFMCNSFVKKNKFNYKHRFCSKKCYAEYRSKFLGGEKHPRWKGGRKYDSYGYIQIWIPNHPYADSHGYVREHRLVLEKSLGRYLRKDEESHHKNHIKDDNRIENLMILSHSEHGKLESEYGHKIDKRKFLKYTNKCSICGKPYYSSKMCKTCYNKNYRKTHKRKPLPYQKKCVYCNKLFNPMKKSFIFCSILCANRNRFKRILRVPRGR